MARGKNIGDLVFNKPQLITLDSLQPITDYLSNPERVANLKFGKLAQEPVLELADFNSEQEYEAHRLASLGINPQTMVGVLDISGTLMYRKGSMGADCTELVSYEALKEQTANMIEAGVKQIVLNVDSNGGMAHALFSTANYISKLAKENGVRTVAYVDGNSYSAAYGLTVLADEIVAHPQASVGSVGVVVALYNDSKALNKAGIKRQFVFAGGNKIPFDNSTGEFTDKFLSDLQKSVNRTYNMFVKHVAGYRGISEQAVIDTQASVYDVEEALQLGLIDKVMELEDFELVYGLKTSNNNATGFNKYLDAVDNNFKQEGNMPKDKDIAEAEMLSLEQVQEQLSLVIAEKEQLNTALVDMQANYEATKEQLEVMKEQLAEVQQAKAQLESEKVQAELDTRVAQRTAKLESALGADNEQVAKLLATTENLSDEQFDVIAQSLTVTQQAQQEQFTELGGEGQESVQQLSLGAKIAQTAKKMKS